MRAWTKNQIRQMEQITVWAAQRCLGIHSQWKRTHHVNAALIQEMVQWEPFEHTIARQSLQWIGHVARMHKDRLPKQALFGSWTNNKIKQHPPCRQGQWIKHLLTQIQVSEMSWFRLAQDRDAWNQAIQQTYPTLVPDTHRTIALNRWTLSAGRPHIPTLMFTRTNRKRSRRMKPDPATGLYQCPACPQQFPRVTALRAHYNAEHRVIDSNKITVATYSAPIVNKLGGPLISVNSTSAPCVLDPRRDPKSTHK